MIIIKIKGGMVESVKNEYGDNLVYEVHDYDVTDYNIEMDDKIEIDENGYAYVVTS